MERIDESNAAEIAEDAREHIAKALHEWRYRMAPRAFDTLQDMVFYILRSEATR